jgi:hypothetical protein
MPLRSLFALLLFVATALPADAQLGGLAKKLKEKAAQAAAEKAGLDTKPGDSAAKPPAYDDVILELSAARVDALLRGLEAQQRVLTADGGIPAILKQRDAIEAQMPALNERANAVSGGYYKAKDRWSSCDSDTRRALEKTHEDEARRMVASMVANPTGAAEKAQKASAAQQALAKAIAENDSLGIKKWTAEYYKAWGIDLTKDDAAVKAKCGAAPALPAAMAELERANARKDSLDVQARAIENRAVLEGSRASGLTEQQFAMARERAQMAATGTRARFSKSELAAIDAKKSELLVFLKP